MIVKAIAANDRDTSDDVCQANWLDGYCTSKLPPPTQPFTWCGVCVRASQGIDPAPLPLERSDVHVRLLVRLLRLKCNIVDVYSHMYVFI